MCQLYGRISSRVSLALLSGEAAQSSLSVAGKASSGAVQGREERHTPGGCSPRWPQRRPEAAGAPASGRTAGRPTGPGTLRATGPAWGQAPRAEGTPLQLRWVQPQSRRRQSPADRPGRTPLRWGEAPLPALLRRPPAASDLCMVNCAHCLSAMGTGLLQPASQPAALQSILAVQGQDHRCWQGSDCQVASKAALLAAIWGSARGELPFEEPVSRRLASSCSCALSSALPSSTPPPRGWSPDACAPWQCCMPQAVVAHVATVSYFARAIALP